MKRVVNKYSNDSNKNFILLIVVFLALFGLSSKLFFTDYKDRLVQRSTSNFDLNINFLNTFFDKNILNYDSTIVESIDKNVDLSLFKDISLIYNKYVFDKSSLLSNTPGFDDTSWQIAEVAVDAKYGFIKKIPNSSLYEFIASTSFDVDLPIVIRYQVYKKGQIRNFLTKLEFKNLKIKKSLDSEKFYKILNGLINVDLRDRTHEVIIDKQVIAVVTYKLNNYSLKQDLHDFITKLIIYTLIMILPILFVVGFYHKYIFKRYVKNPVVYLNKYLDNIIGNKYTTIDKSNFEGTEEIVELTKKITKISSKIASLTNELNINKETLELKVSTDTLTGLPNKSIFDFDVKNMFVSLTKGYISIIKIDDLTKLSKDHDSGYINNFIEHYVSSIKNTVYKFSKSDIKLYRFYGSQFAFVAKNMNAQQLEKICDTIIKNLIKDMEGYTIPDDMIQIACTSFDLYGTIDSNIELANKSYELSKAKGPNSYNVVAEEDIAKNYELLDNNVKDIIDSGNFDIKFVLETYSFDNPEEVLIKEVSPILLDHNNEKLLIGSFVSVAQKLELIDKFDKEVIQKAVNFIEVNKVNYELAVNLSFASIVNEDFISWLDKLIEEKNDIMNKIVFSITAYSAYLNKRDFERFIKHMSDVGGKVLLKRYKTEEYPLEKLNGLNLEYIRIHKDYTSNFTNDVVKKHKVKNTLIYGELNNIKVITDTVKLDLDYNLLDRLGTYGTSR